ncbi:hypothetical protein ACFQE1_09545 [Halobium palmae]|uniref:Cox cluster protein n=1 Tax=Halobium palmae TaxID=1776492 RepID=A0ABD5RYT8_9EURY
MDAKGLLGYAAVAPIVVLCAEYAVSVALGVPFTLLVGATFLVSVVGAALLFGADSPLENAAVSAAIGGSSDPTAFDESRSPRRRLGFLSLGLGAFSFLSLVVLVRTG